MLPSFLHSATVKYKIHVINNAYFNRREDFT